jgi:glutathione S-transferase
LAGEHKTEEYYKINPSGLVPSIQDGDFNLGEGAAILTYLANTNNLTNWYPTDLKQRAKVDQWLHWHHSTLRNSTTKILVPFFLKSTPTSTDLKKWNKDLKFLEKELSQTTFLASSSHPTIADLMAIPELDQLTTEGFGVFDYSPYPNILRYMTSVRESVSSYEDVFQPVVKQKLKMISHEKKE